MYNPKEEENKKTIVKFRKIEIVLALGCGYNPDESEERGVPSHLLTKPYLKYKNSWYYIKNNWRWTRLSDIKDYLKNSVYTEEQFLEKIIELI